MQKDVNIYNFKTPKLREKMFGILESSSVVAQTRRVNKIFYKIKLLSGEVCGENGVHIKLREQKQTGHECIQMKTSNQPPYVKLVGGYNEVSIPFTELSCQNATK